MGKFLATVEAKVKAATTSALVVSVVLALLNWLVGHNDALGSTPPWLQFLVITLAPPAAAAVAGYKARHTAIAPVKS